MDHNKWESKTNLCLKIPEELQGFENGGDGFAIDGMDGTQAAGKQSNKSDAFSLDVLSGQKPLEQDGDCRLTTTENTTSNWKVCVTIFGIIFSGGAIVAVAIVLFTLYFKSEPHDGIYVSTDATLCEPIARKIIKDGGTVVDAAIATLVCMGATHPHASGLGGGFLMTIYNRSINKVTVLDAREISPEQATENIFQNIKLKRGLAVAVPLELAGYVSAHKDSKLGRLPWKDLFQPTIQLCREGFSVTHSLATALAEEKQEVLQESGLREVFLNNETGELFKEDEIMRRLDLARTLEAIANNSDQSVFPRLIIRDLVDEIAEFGGIITKADFASAAGSQRSHVSLKLINNHTLFTFPPPGGGVFLATTLSILNEFNTSKIKLGTEYDSTAGYHHVMEAVKFGYGRVADFEAYEESLEISKQKKLWKEVLSSKVAENTNMKILENATYDVVSEYGKEFYVGKDQSTAAHVSIVAPNGDAVSATSSLNHRFGSKLRSRSTGIIFNDQMYSFTPPSSNISWNKIRLQSKPMSYMSPSIITDSNGEVKMVIGGTGGVKIISGLALVTARILWSGESLKDSIDAPRLHPLLPNILEYEDCFPKDILDGLQKFGHKLQKSNREASISGILRNTDGKTYEVVTEEIHSNGRVC